MKLFLVLSLLFGFNLYAELIKNISTGVVTDTATGLKWQDNKVGKRMTWTDAVSHCDMLDLDGKGWRLPSIDELQSIVYVKKNPNFIDTFWGTTISDEFQNTYTGNYWSSTTNKENENNAWYVFFRNGAKANYRKTSKFHFRCVRHTGQ